MEEKGINIVSAIDERFPITQDLKTIVDYFRKSHPILKNEKFKDFVITKIFNEYYDFFYILENKMIINNITQSIYENDLDSVNRLHFMSLNAFIVFDDCFSKKSMRYKLSSLPSIKEEMFNEILKYLLSYTMSYSNSIFEVFSEMDKTTNIRIVDLITFFDLDPFKNMKFLNADFALKKIQELKNITNVVIKMEMADRIILYSKLFRYIHQFIISQNSYSSVKEIDSVLNNNDDYYHFNSYLFVLSSKSTFKLI